MSSRILALASSAVAIASCSQPRVMPEPVTRRYGVADLQADVRQLRAAVYEAAPDLNRYRSRAQIDSAFDALRVSATQPLTAIEFWRAAARTVALVRDGHLEVIPSASLFRTIYQDSAGYVLPFSIRVVDERLYVLRNYLPTGGPPDGSEIVSVNGLTTSAFLRQCAATISVDGDVATRAPRRIERDFPSTCALAAGLPSQYTLRFVRRGTIEVDTMTIDAVPWATRRGWVAARSPADTLAAPPASLRLLADESIAVMTLHTFSKENRFDPTAFIDSAFDAIRAASVGTLILDLRPNHGGPDWTGAHLVSYIARDTFTYAERRAARKRHFDFVQGFDGWWFNLQLRFRYASRRDTSGMFVIQERLDRPQQPHARGFRGRVIVLVDGTTVSTGTAVAAVLAHYRLATLVGEESANAWSGGSGATVSIELDRTKLIVNIPVVQYRLVGWTSAPEGRGVQPDIVRPRTIEDLLAGRDRAMEAALELARAATANPERH